MRGITLHLFGGAAEMEAEPTSARAELLMALAGPATSVAIGLLLRALLWATGLPADQPAGIVLRYLSSLNLVLAAFNMMPAFPLDGGRVLRAAVWGATGDVVRATRLAARIGAALGFAVSALGVLQILGGAFAGGLWMVLIGFFIRSAALTARVDVDTRTMFTGKPVSALMTPEPVVVGPTLSVADFLEQVVYRSRHDVYPVVDGAGAPRGLVAVGSLHRLPREDWASTSVVALMDPVGPDMVVAPATDTVAALDQMRRSGQTRLLVVADGRLVGLLTLKDLLETLDLKMQFEGAP